MAFYILKVFITTVLVILVSEVTKRYTLMGAVIASIPLVSVLAMIWLYVDTGDIHKIINFSNSVFWLVLPSLVLFLVLPLLLNRGLGFTLSLFLSVVCTALSYWGTISIVDKLGLN